MNIGDKFQTAVFWITADQIILFAELVRPDYRGIADYPFTHVDKWQDVIRAQKQLQTLSYDDFPRGRSGTTTTAKHITSLSVLV